VRITCSCLLFLCTIGMTFFAMVCDVSAQASDVPPAAEPDTQRVIISAGTDKDVYKLDELIEIRAAIHNQGTVPFYVYPSAGFGYYGEGVFVPELRNEKGKEISELFRVGGHSFVPANADFAEYVEQHWILLHPGQFYGAASKRFIGVRLHPGTYTLRVTYSNSFVPWVFRGWTAERLEASARKLKYPAVSGKIVSPAIAFRVIP